LQDAATRNLSLNSENEFLARKVIAAVLPHFRGWGLLPQGGVDPGGDLLGEFYIITDIGEQLAQRLVRAPGVYLYGPGHPRRPRNARSARFIGVDCVDTRMS
jgi:hypothetical protein